MTLEHFDSIFAFVIIITGVSLIVTLLNQAVSAALGLRGSQLRWGLETLLANLDPSLKQHAKTISEKVLQHPLISDSAFSRFNNILLNRWRLASAIRQDELMHILQLLANGGTAPTSKSTVAPAAAVAPGAQPVPAAPSVPPPGAKEDWQQALAKSLQQVDPNADRDIQLIASDLRSLFPQDASKADRLIAAARSQANQLRGNIEQWFDSVMDRSAQRFSLNMRVWTVAFSVLIAFALQLDAFSLFTRVSSDAELRARLVASADGLTRKADDLLLTTSNGVPSTVYVGAMKQLISDYKSDLGRLPVPSGFSTLEDAQKWLSNALKQINIPVTNNEWAVRYEQRVPQYSLRTSAQELQSLLTNKLSLDILPSSYPKPFYENWSPRGRTFWGILASAALLSLGAPFWFNALKTMSNLRPLLANKQQAESEADDN